MSTGTNVARAVTMPWKPLLGLLVISAAVAGLQSCGYDVRQSIKSYTVVAENVACTVSKFDKEGKVQLNCPGHGNKTVTDSELALAFAVKPRPLNCKIYTGAEPDCEVKAK